MLLKHLIKKHKQQYDEALRKLNGGQSNTLDKHVVKVSTSNLKLIQWIVMDNQAISVVDNEYFCAYIATFSTTPVPCRDTVRKYIIEHANTVQTIVKGKISNQFLALTTDKWTSINNKSFESVTAHYIDENFDYHSIALKCSPSLQKDSTAESIITDLREAINDNGSKIDMISAVVADTEATMNRVVLDMRDKYNVEASPCVCHKLELVTGNAYGGDDDSFLSTTMRKMRSVIGYFRRGDNMKRLIFSQTLGEEGMPYKILFEDVVTRFWSTYNAVERFIELKESINQTLPHKHTGVLHDKEWKFLEWLTKVLKPFMMAQKFLEGEKTVTISSVCHLVGKLWKTINNSLNGETREDYLNLLNALANKLRAEYGGPDEIFSAHKQLGERQRVVGFQKSHLISAIVDPRIKTVNSISLDELSELKGMIVSEMDSCQKLTSVLNNDSVTYNQITTELDDSDTENFFGFTSNTYNSFQDTGNNELSRYLASPLLSWKCDPLEWWRINQASYPRLAIVARKYLCIPASSAPSERIFSTAGLIITEKRNRISDELAEDIIFLKKNWEIAFPEGNNL